ncbi:hypothetical protein [Aliidiomarina sanyensis]|uniref:Uncharacterized protein n=1 Tax=Aliidiomarina sanyensis TaxID=1249555 RepID=A0A432WS63_9GAMM|nr:hypothetical protein [Aliidiomarina sanyensis]RUO36588.1 hypothetical protein CWE11_01895 [Aliidiomarina sanyensis]
MSKLDKEQVLADYTAAYEKAHGKKPDIAENSGWYSVDGGKNVRLAQLAEEAATLGGSKPAAKKPSAGAKKDKASAAKKEPAKKPAAKKSSATKSANKGAGGLTAKELWKQRLAEQPSARLPRGMQS